MKPRRTTYPLIRFQRFVAVQENGCWLWTGASYRDGYGEFYMEDGKCIAAHRAAWLLLRGDVPQGLELDHLCRVRRCVNPDHLEPVTRRVNTLRGVGPAATNAVKTHCPQGHPLVEGNIYWHKRRYGGLARDCATCHRDRARAKRRSA